MSSTLTPKKHLNLDTSLLRVFSLVLKELQKRGVCEFEKLRGVVIRRVGANGELSFLPALDLLFLLGKAEYHLKNDTLEYKGTD
ncbi:ABC-three component system middle component 8 [Ensifer adhaerens]|uniref:ABC-three component system middle component 8 n=1 Tax=Ensifer adhaerens TaxID=106592 RepID=UPI003F87CD99